MKRLAVLGYPVGHSRSPAMQNAALAELGLSDEWSYEAIEIAPDRFEARVREMPGEGFVGANVTVPHKEAALALADSPSPMATAVGAANTLTFDGGRIHAENTDVTALVGTVGWELEGKRALVLGAGGAARAIVWALVEEGAEVDVWNRTRERAEGLCGELGGKPVEAPAVGSYELIVNTTSVGLHGEDPFAELPLKADDFSSRQVVLDLVYGERPTRLLEAAGSMGATTIDGIEFLVRQGAQSLRIWTGRDAPLETMRAAARA